MLHANTLSLTTYHNLSDPALFVSLMEIMHCMHAGMAGFVTNGRPIYHVYNSDH